MILKLQLHIDEDRHRCYSQAVTGKLCTTIVVQIPGSKTRTSRLYGGWGVGIEGVLSTHLGRSGTFSGTWNCNWENNFLSPCEPWLPAHRWEWPSSMRPGDTKHAGLQMKGRQAGRHRRPARDENRQGVWPHRPGSHNLTILSCVPPQVFQTPPPHNMRINFLFLLKSPRGSSSFITEEVICNSEIYF